jgi:MFS family permease
MVTGLGLLGATLLTMSLAGSLPAWVLLMACQGAFGPLYRIGADAMIADLVPPDRRAQAYAWQRMATNLGIAIGPSVGGFVTATSYTLAFYIAAAGNLTFALLVLLFARETLPRRSPLSAPTESPGQAATHSAGKAGYGPVLRDRRFMAFVAITTLATIPATLVMVLLAVYAKEQFGVPENRYGFVMATNAAMVVLFQVLVTHFSRRYPPFRVLAAGALLYALGAGSVAWGSTFPAFLLSMIVLTLGELLLVPTANALTASLAPADMRGRYMGIYGLTWGVAYGLGPVLGGLLSDQIAPVATWYGGLLVGLAAAAGFLLLSRSRAP